MRNMKEEAVDARAFENAEHRDSHEPCLLTSFHKLRLREQIPILYSHHKTEFLN